MPFFYVVVIIIGNTRIRYCAFYVFPALCVPLHRVDFPCLQVREIRGRDQKVSILE